LLSNTLLTSLKAINGRESVKHLDAPAHATILPCYHTTLLPYYHVSRLIPHASLITLGVCPASVIPHLGLYNYIHLYQQHCCASSFPPDLCTCNNKSLCCRHLTTSKMPRCQHLLPHTPGCSQVGKHQNLEPTPVTPQRAHQGWHVRVLTWATTCRAST